MKKLVQVILEKIGSSNSWVNNNTSSQCFKSEINQK